MVLHALTLGLDQERTRRRLFETENLTLDKAIGICRLAEDTEFEIKKLHFLARFNKIAIPNNKFQMASGQGSHWLIESPTIFSSMCSPPLSNICQFYF